MKRRPHPFVVWRYRSARPVVVTPEPEATPKPPPARAIVPPWPEPHAIAELFREAQRLRG